MGNAFAGIIFPDVLQMGDLLGAMLAPMRHRGSDRYITHTSKNIQIGCLGGPFATNSKKTLFCSLDGWIENGKELKKQLKSSGLTWTPQDDQELIIACYEMWSCEFLKKLNGDFALLLLDQDKGHLLLARDPVGKKPLYWYHDNKYFIFGSEIKALLATGIIPQTSAPDALSSYFFFGFIPQDMTPIFNVHKLLPAHYLIFSQNRGKQIVPYWSYSSFFSKHTQQNLTEITEQINELLTDCVKARIPAEEPLGCFLLGGLGSATNAYFLKKLAKDQPLEAFTVGFWEEYEEDIVAARSACKSLQIPQTINEITPATFFSEFAKIVWYLDEPLADPNVMATWKLAKDASSFTSTVYSGMGSDELLAGHSRYTLAERDVAPVNKLLMLPPAFIKHFLIPFSRIFYPKVAYNILRACRTNPWQYEYLRHSALFDAVQLGEAAPKLAKMFDPETFLHRFYNISRIPSNVSSLIYFDVKTRLPDLFIAQYERLTRAAGLIWHTPFLDKRMLEYTAGLPEPESLFESQSASYLKPLVHNVFPQSFINRPKKTRRQFLSTWIEHQDVADLFQLLLRGTLVETGIISEDWLRKQLSTQNMLPQAFPQLFAILTLEVWFRLFLNRSISLTPPNVSLQELLNER